MDPEYFGDSYDFVTRTLLSVKPHNRDFLEVPMFTKESGKKMLDLHIAFLGVKRPLWDECLVPEYRRHRANWLERIRTIVRKGPYHLFLNPNTGIRAGDNEGKKPRDYIGMNDLKVLLKDSGDMLLLCYDQSFAYAKEDELKKARAKKLRELGSSGGIHSCYFWSHTCILAASCNEEVLSEWKEGVLALGVPDCRLQDS